MVNRKISDEEWTRAAKTHLDFGGWNVDAFGPPPGQANCECPARILRKIGHPKAPPAIYGADGTIAPSEAPKIDRYTALRGTIEDAKKELGNGATLQQVLSFFDRAANDDGFAPEDPGVVNLRNQLIEIGRSIKKPNGPNGSAAGEMRRTGKKPPLVFERLNQVDINQLPKEYLIFEMLGRHELSCWYGAPESGKSTVLIDANCHVALGKAYRTRKVVQGPVLYVAAERGRTVKRRAVAWAMHHNSGNRDFPFYVIDDAIDLRNNRVDMQRIIEACEAIAIAEGAPVVWIVFDTLSRVLAGGDESSSKDMGQLVKHIDELFRRTNAHITLVHHNPLGADRMRGWGGVNGALDTSVSITKSTEKVISLEVVKASDMPEEKKPRFAFTISSQNIAPEHAPEQTAGVAWEESDERLPEKKAPAGTNGKKSPKKTRKPDGPVGTKQVRDALDEVIAEKGLKNVGSNNADLNKIPSGVRIIEERQWRQEAYKTMPEDMTNDGKSSRFRNSMQYLLDNEIIGKYDQVVWIVPDSARKNEEQS